MGKVAVTAAVIGAAAMCAVVALLVRHQLRNSSQSSRAAAILKEFEEKRGTPESKLKQVADAMPVEMHAGLVSEGRSKLKMLISYVDNLPAGHHFLLEFQIVVTLIHSIAMNNGCKRIPLSALSHSSARTGYSE
ncbi:hexokinase-1-like [Daucus carota subsp. sativus]|uniref:hexokinase-1-like n=1 Tax=Daucus carota subsp. sativus TaxID=79200 RepID=UPI0030833386